MTLHTTADHGPRPIPLSELIDFRASLYGCLTRWGDALFELADASLSSSAPVGSVPSLSLESVFTRSHGSLYKALEQGRIDDEALERLLVATRPKNWPSVFAVDASTWGRCDAETSPERGFYYWSYQWITELDWAPDSWTAPLGVRRLSPRENATDATIDQVRHLVGLLPGDAGVPLFVFDAGYDPIAIGAGLSDLKAQALVRISAKRVFYPDPEHPTPGRAGRPRRHGQRFTLSDPATWTTPDAELVDEDTRYGKVHVQSWSNLHPKLSGKRRWCGDGLPPIVRGTVIRVEVERLPKPTARAKKTLWLWWSGEGQPDLDLCWRSYLRRFDIEHTFRFLKGTLGWTTPALRTPEQADRWTWLVVAAYTQLRLARGLVDDLRLPWERPRDPAKLTPARVRRGFHRLRATLGTPAHPPKSTKAGPGRPKGTRKPPRTRYPVVKKAA
jgi:hypothetical protein